MFSGRTHKINDMYYLGSIDADEDMSLYRDLGEGNGIGRIEPTVFAVGWDSIHIIAKQHPSKNKKVTNYFILDMTKDNKYADPSKSVIGPLDEKEFEAKRITLGVSQQLSFTLVIDNIK